MLRKNSPTLDQDGAVRLGTREFERTEGLHAALLKDQRFFVTTEVDLCERFGVGAGCISHDVILTNFGVIRLECSGHRGNSLSIAHEIDLYLRAGSLPLDLVVAGFQLRPTDLYGIRNLYRV